MDDAPSSTASNGETENRLNGSPDLRGVKNSAGLSWSEFRLGLVPDFKLIFFNALVCWVMIALGGAAFYALAQSSFALWGFALILPGALWFDFWLQAYATHFHEAAHFNLAPDPVWNDRLAVLLLVPFIGLDLKSYRMSHWKHHLFLGTAQDTETSYVTPITLRKILYVASGLYLLGVFLRYARVYRGLDKKSSGKGNSQAAYFRSLAFMIVCQCALTAAWACWVSVPSALAWVLGYVLFGPLLVWLRQTMEHRSMDAGSMPVYEFSRYAPTNRLFGSDIFSRFFGAAGFNKHLLHHWDPSVSYTCFPQMEMFLMDTDLREQLQSCSTTYWATFNAMNASRF